MKLTKWITCLAGPKIKDCDAYRGMFKKAQEFVKVAVESCILNTNLEPVIVYDGEQNELTEWLNKKGVKIINYESPFIKFFQDSQWTCYEKEVMRGVFMRLALPELVKKLGLEENHLLYADYDIIFMKNFNLEELCSQQTQILSIAPSDDISNTSLVNSGVIIKNIFEYNKIYPTFKKHVLNELHHRFPQDYMYKGHIDPYDEILYQEYFRGKFNLLPPKYNWRPYWGFNKNAQIIHFHGLKPYHRHNDMLSQPQNYPLKKYVNNAFFIYAAIWDKYLSLAESDV